MSGAYFSGGAAESCAINEQDQRLTEGCGPNRPVEAKSEIPAVPAPSLREKLKAIRDSDHPASHWARNIIQTMDEAGDAPTPDQLKALAFSMVMFERTLGHYPARWHDRLEPDQIAAIFGLSGNQ